MFKLTIDTGNAAFDDDTHPIYARDREIARILRALAKKLEDDCAENAGKLFDSNGNRVGEFQFGEE